MTTPKNRPKGNQTAHMTRSFQEDRVVKLHKLTNDDNKVFSKRTSKNQSEFNFYIFRDTFAYKLHLSNVDITLIQ